MIGTNAYICDPSQMTILDTFVTSRSATGLLYDAGVKICFFIFVFDQFTPPPLHDFFIVFQFFKMTKTNPQLKPPEAPALFFIKKATIYSKLLIFTALRYDFYLVNF
jgi:hypothetical protein